VSASLHRDRHHSRDPPHSRHELFFKFLKQNLKLKGFNGTSQERRAHANLDRLVRGVDGRLPEAQIGDHAVVPANFPPVRDQPVPPPRLFSTCCKTSRLTLPLLFQVRRSLRYEPNPMGRDCAVLVVHTASSGILRHRTHQVPPPHARGLRFCCSRQARSAFRTVLHSLAFLAAPIARVGPIDLHHAAPRPHPRRRPGARGAWEFHAFIEKSISKELPRLRRATDSGRKQRSTSGMAGEKSISKIVRQPIPAPWVSDTGLT
jgi:hypothetical protein